VWVVTKEVSRSTAPSSVVQQFLALVTREGDTKQKNFVALTTIGGKNALFSYDTFVDAGLCYRDGNGRLPEPQDNILVITTKQGNVVLNNTTKEIRAGNMLYRVGSETSLFYYKMKESGEQELLIDFRAAFGWTANILDITYTGDSCGVKIREDNEIAEYLVDVRVNAVPAFKTETVGLTVPIIPRGVYSDVTVDTVKLVMSADYPLANWFVYSAVNGTTGQEESYLFIFYPEYAYEGRNDKPDDWEELKSIIGYYVRPETAEVTEGEIDYTSWACRCVPLEMKQSFEEGKMCYTKEYGYTYNVPTFQQDSVLNDYLSGNILLPIFRNIDDLVNVNVNYWQDVPYGQRPVFVNRSTHEYKFVDIRNYTVVDENGNEVRKQGSVSEIYPAPVGVCSYYGGVSREYRTYEEQDKVNRYVYFGTSKGSVVKVVDADTVTLSLPYDEFSCNQTISIDEFKLYRVGLRAIKNKDAELLYDFEETLVVAGASLRTEGSAEDSTISNKEVNIKELEEESRKSFEGFGDWSLQNLINKIDEGASFIIVFTFEILPLFFGLLLVVLTGCAMAGDSKIVQLFADKVIDPVKVLTFGKRQLQEFKIVESWWVLVLGYIAFGLAYQGNLLRIVEWTLTYLGKFAEYIQYL